jgi:hypothetical protein
MAGWFPQGSDGPTSSTTCALIHAANPATPQGDAMDDQRWQFMSRLQEGVIARRQLAELGVTQAAIRNHLRVGRWSKRTDRVLTTTTGHLTWQQRLWVAVLHAGPKAYLGGLTACEQNGLQGWSRPEVTVVVDDELSFDPVAGVRFFRSRRPLAKWRASGALPALTVEASVLLFAGYEASRRTALGAISAVVQQRLSDPARLQEQLATMRPLRGAADFRALLADLAGGAQSLAEVDLSRACAQFGVLPPQRQLRRRDSRGAWRFTDAEWFLRNGSVVVLEVDGAFHMEVQAYTADMRRQRRLARRNCVVVRCSAYEIRHEPDEVMRDLIALGVPRVPPEDSPELCA